MVRSATFSSGLKIVTRDDQTAGLYVKGKDYTLSNSTIEVHGNSAGWDENFGVGAGAVAGPGTTLTLRNVTVTTQGIKASGIAAAGGVLKVYDSTIHAKGGLVPAENLVPGSGPDYVGPPEALDIRGTARASNVIGSGNAYYYHSHFISDGWGALSTDSANPSVYLEANDCDVEARNSGYGTYADINAEVVINHTRFRTATATGIISVNGRITLNDVTESTATNGVMIHAPGRDFLRVATLVIKGGRFATREATVLVRSHNADILFDGADLRPRNGVLLQSILNDSKRSALLQWYLSPQKPANVVTGPVTGVRATFRDMNARGDIRHDDTTRTMTLVLEHTQLRGAILGTVWAIGDVSVAVKDGSRWTATADSRVTLLGATDASVFDAARGVTITALAGEGTTLAGRYRLAHGGELVVKGLPATR